MNLASQCGFTPQYAALSALFNKYGKRGFTVLGFPVSYELMEFMCTVRYALRHGVCFWGPPTGGEAPRNVDLVMSVRECIHPKP